MRGISVVEIVGVLALLGILGLAALVWVPADAPARLDAAAKQMQSDIEHARQLAMTSAATHGVQFIAGGSYTVYRGTIATPVLSPLTHLNMVVNLGTLYPGVSLQNAYTVEFDRFGAPLVGGGGSVTVTNGTQTRQIAVVAVTGRVVLQ